jgi:hypothetical protein
MHKLTHVIPVRAKGKTTLKRIEANLKFQLSTTRILEACAVSFTLRGNALEGYQFEITDSLIVDLTGLIDELTKQASKLKG